MGIGSFSQDPLWFLKKLKKKFYQMDKKTWEMVGYGMFPDFDYRIKIETLWAYKIKLHIHSKITYSREQKHVSISDTPMLLIEIDSISNMGCQK